ncbi:MAG: amidotransferase [Planctomycetales bacterium 4572_13]|nr:MAG: amidotransferase [Planctomycetales bacterium 4572_13]
MRIHCLTHVPFEDAANIGEWTKLHGHSLTYTHLYLDESLPPPESFDMLAVMGGPMNVYEHDRYPWLVSEKDFIQQAIDAEKKIIGVCLGAQLIADVLGGEVFPNDHKEIGWHPIQLNPQAAQSKVFLMLPPEMMVFHWHGDTFSLPPGVIHLASSGVCENQAFQYGDHVLGLQFHLEYSAESLEKMLAHCGNELIDAPHIQTADEIRGGIPNLPTNTLWLRSLLDAFLAT